MKNSTRKNSVSQVAGVVLGVLILIAMTDARSGMVTLKQAHLDSAMMLARTHAAGKLSSDATGLPAGSWLEAFGLADSVSADTMVGIRIFTPWARAARVAAAALRGAVDLDAKVWNPDLYNVGVLLTVEGSAGKRDTTPHVREVICLSEGVVREPIWARADTVHTDTSRTARPMVTFQGLFPPEVVNDARDLEVFVNTDRGSVTVLIRGAALSRLR